MIYDTSFRWQGRQIVGGHGVPQSDVSRMCILKDRRCGLPDAETRAQPVKPTIEAHRVQ